MSPSVARSPSPSSPKDNRWQPTRTTWINQDFLGSKEDEEKIQLSSSPEQAVMALPSTDSMPPSVKERIEKMWSMPATFGEEQKSNVAYLSIMANRYALVRGAQLIRDELMPSFNTPDHKGKNVLHDRENMECSADLELPSVLTTCGFSMCGDRICQSAALRRYQAMVRSKTQQNDSPLSLHFVPRRKKLEKNSFLRALM